LRTLLTLIEAASAEEVVTLAAFNGIIYQILACKTLKMLALLGCELGD
jgi:hypothetical protein